MPWRRIGEWRYLHTFLILALDGGEWSVWCPSCFAPGKEPLVPTCPSHCITLLFCVLFELPSDSFTSSYPVLFQSYITFLSNKCCLSNILFPSSMPSPCTETFMSLFSHFLPKNSQSVILQLQQMKLKWKDHMDIAWHK